MSEPLLSVEHLTTRFHTDEGTVHAVEDVSFTVDRGETVCLVGESGSGKSVTCESITRLIPVPPGEIVGGTVTLEGTDLTTLSERQLRDIRGGRIAYVFQNPQNALDPVYTVREQLVEAIRSHRDLDREAARGHAVELLDDVGIPNPAARAEEYPYQFSGGMRQRVLIAMALAPEPDLLIADEPTTALDVTTEAQILELIGDLQAERDMAVLFVTHDLGVVAEIADEVVVLYGGKVMERGAVEDVFETPAHPYTRALLRCLPGQGSGMQPIGGSPPDASAPPSGCRFHPRCPHAVAECRDGGQPQLNDVPADTEHVASCVYYGGGYDPSVVLEADAPDGTSGRGPPGGTGDDGFAWGDGP